MSEIAGSSLGSTCLAKLSAVAILTGSPFLSIKSLAR